MRVRLLADRSLLIRVAMLAVVVACAVFMVSRLSITLATGAATPWWGNALGLLATLGLWFWMQREPQGRRRIAVHGTASVVVMALLLPVAYNMPSTLWWLALVPFTMVLLESTTAGVVWAGLVVPLMGLAIWAKPWIQVEGAAGEGNLEQILARGVFTVLLMAIAYGFRWEVEQRTLAQAETNRLLEHSNAAKARFMAQISHDLRNPLHGVLAMTDLALLEDLAPNARAHLRTSQSNARLLLRLLNDVLEVTRAEGQQFDLEPAPFDLHLLLRDVLLPFRARAAAKGIALTARAEPGLVRRRQGDAARITQIINNLLTNALKFTESGSIDVRVGGEAGAGVVLRVIDSGRGVRPDDNERIFAPFEQADDADAGLLGGVGLGLAISRELARRMGGDLVCEPRDDGACFRLDLNLPTLNTAAGPVDLLERDAPNVTKQPACTVLVVDDDPTNRTILQQFLQRLGHEVRLAACGEDALICWRRGGVDIVLTDVQMPEMSGVELMQILHNEDASVPVVVCTASGGPDLWSQLHQAGAMAALWKPFVLLDVADVMANVLAQTSVASSTSTGSSGS